MNNENEEDNYFPVEPNKYQFLALRNVIPGLDAKINEDVKEVYICGYRINNEYLNPFLEYLLQKNSTATELIFPSLYLPNNCEDVLTLVSNLDSLLILLLLGSNTDANLNCSFIDMYKGYYCVKEKMYVFFDLTKMEIKLNDVYRENNLWFCLIYEILNSGHVCGTLVSDSVKTFLLSNVYKYPFFLLQDENEDPYEVPYVVYVGTHEKKLNFIYTFGVSKNNNDDSLFGPYYYFTDFNNAIRQGGWSMNNKSETLFGKIMTDNEFGRYKKGGIIRFALFLGKVNVKLNLKSDEVDLSQIKKDRLLDTTLDTNYERLTIRISDYDGLWVKKYDTIIAEDIELDDGSKLRNTPMYVSKDYERQCPLSYHYLNKKTLGEKYDKSSHFSIM